jgi:hypothetical protein
MLPQKHPSVAGLAATATIPELQQSKSAVLNTLASTHSRRSYAHAIERFIAWYCSEPRLEFNRSVKGIWSVGASRQCVGVDGGDNPDKRATGTSQFEVRATQTESFSRHTQSIETTVVMYYGPP